VTRITIAGGALLAALCLVISAAPAKAATASRSEFGKMPDGRAIEAVTLTNGHGVSVRVISYGAAIQSVMTPDRDGKLADIVLGYPSLDGYINQPQYFGATVGRFANRIAKGRFTIDGKSYQTPTNNGPNSLHGGLQGFDKVVWTVTGVKQGPVASATLAYASPDGDQGYPGTLKTTATYSLDEQDHLTIDYRAKTDKPTIVNLSNHAYWNLSGEGSGSVLDDLVTIDAAEITPVDSTLIPTGAFQSVAGTPFDFRTPKPLGQDIRDARSEQLLFGKGYDMNWVVSRTAVAAPRPMASVTDPKSGRVIEVSSTQPGLQFYSGNFLDGTVIGKSERTYRQSDAFVMEPQMFPDTPNHPDFGSAVLRPGKQYENIIIFRFSTEKR